MAEIANSVGWQSPGIRGFISTVTKKMALKIESLKNEAGERPYRVAKQVARAPRQTARRNGPLLGGLTRWFRLTAAVKSIVIRQLRLFQGSRLDDLCQQDLQTVNIPCELLDFYRFRPQRLSKRVFCMGGSPTRELQRQ